MKLELQEERMAVGLHHEFFFVELSEFGHDEYWNGHERAGALLIHDDFLNYMADSLHWIETYNPARREPYQGLCWYGPTVIRLEGAQQTRDIFQGWANLFSLGPDTLKLHGGYTFDDEHPEGYYARLDIDRDPMVYTLRMIATYADRIITSEGKSFILHMGI